MGLQKLPVVSQALGLWRWGDLLAHGGWDCSLAEIPGCLQCCLRSLLSLFNPDAVWPASSDPCYLDYHYDASNSEAKHTHLSLSCFC